MRLPTTLVVLWIFTATHIVAADNPKGLDAVLEKHRAAVAKADLARNNAVQKSRDDTVALLAKFATDAYSKKDRSAETAAWKAVIQLDHNHLRARQYFKDLGTLDKVLAELPPNHCQRR